MRNIFGFLEEVRDFALDWLKCYIEVRPHDALGKMDLDEFGEFGGEFGQADGLGLGGHRKAVHAAMDIE